MPPTTTIPVPSGGGGGLSALLAAPIALVVAYFRIFGWFGLFPIAFFWVVGSARMGTKWTVHGVRRQFGSGLGNAILGVMAFLGIATYLHKNRRHAGQVLVALVGAGCTLALIIAINATDGGWRRLIIIGTLLTLLAAPWPAGSLWPTYRGGWAWRRIGDRPLAQWAADRALGISYEAGVQKVVPGAAVGQPVTGADGVTRATVTVPAGASVSDLDADRIGTALAHQSVGAVRHVEIVARPEAGVADLIVADQPPAPPADPWDVLRKVDTLWRPRTPAGPSSSIWLGRSITRDGRTVGDLTIPNDGYHVLVGGATGEGKSKVGHVILAELAQDPNEQCVILDPTRIEFRAWTPRLVQYAAGSAACHAGWRWAVQLMEARYRFLDEVREPQWRIGVHGPRLNLFVEEFNAHVSAKSMTDLPLDAEGNPIPAKDVAAENQAAHNRLAAECRKTGIRLWTFIQRPDHTIMETFARQNYGRRLAFALDDTDGNRMLLGAGAKDAGWDATTIPIKGGVIVRMARGEYVQGRAGWLGTRPPTGQDDDALDASQTAGRIAAQTAHLIRPLYYDMEEVS